MSVDHMAEPEGWTFSEDDRAVMHGYVGELVTAVKELVPWERLQACEAKLAAAERERDAAVTLARRMRNTHAEKPEGATTGGLRGRRRVRAPGPRR